MRALALLLALLLASCTSWQVPVPVGPTPPVGPVQPPVDPPVPVEPPGPVEPPPPILGMPAIGTTKADVVAAWGAGTDLPENPGEDDVVAYLRTVDGRDAEVHLIFRAGRLFRVVVTTLVTPGG